METSWEEDANFQFMFYHVHQFSGPVGWGIDTVSSLRPLDTPRTTAVVVFSTVNGYHAYRTKPPVGLPLMIVPEPNNPVDRNALRVDVATNIDRGTRIVYPGVAGVAGKCVGRVPIQLSSVLTPTMHSGIVKSVTAFFTGRILHHGPVGGGGPKLSACYLVHVTARDEFVSLLQAAGIDSDNVLL